MKERPPVDGRRVVPADGSSPERQVTGSVSGPEDFDRWWTAHEGEIRRRARSKYGASAADFVQSTYLKLREQSSTLVFRAIGALVRRELHNQWINEWREETERGRRDFEPEAMALKVDEGMDSAQRAARSLFKERVFQFLNSAEISDEERQAFVAYYFEDLTDAAIADAQGVRGESTARMRREKVMRMLREQLSAQGIEAASDLFDAE